VTSSGGCAHITGITAIKHAKRRECEECGATLCCDDSPNRHATKHARASGHPVIASAEPGERWLYCYPDDQFMEY
jgi:hypothetical protein